MNNIEEYENKIWKAAIMAGFDTIESKYTHKEVDLTGESYYESSYTFKRGEYSDGPYNIIITGDYLNNMPFQEVLMYLRNFNVETLNYKVNDDYISIDYIFNYYDDYETIDISISLIPYFDVGSYIMDERCSIEDLIKEQLYTNYLNKCKS